MSDIDLRAFYHRYIDMLNARKFNRIDDFVHDRVTVKGQPYRRDDVLAAWEDLVDAVARFHMAGRRPRHRGRIGVAVRLLDTGTPVKEWLGLDATGARVAFTEFAILQGSRRSL